MLVPEDGVRVDGTYLTLAELSRVTKANWISASNVFGDIHLADALEVNVLSFNRCRGEIVLGNQTMAATGVSYLNCPKVHSISKDLTCGQHLIAKDCHELTSIGRGLIINPGRKQDLHFTKLGIEDCPSFERIDGPATLNSLIDLKRVPSFEGLSPAIEQMGWYSSLTADIATRNLPKEWTVTLPNVWREMYKQQQSPAIMAPAMEPGIY